MSYKVRESVGTCVCDVLSFVALLNMLFLCLFLCFDNGFR